MGWSTGFTILEKTIIDCYDAGRLDATLLKILMTPYRDTDIDEGGIADRRSADGKDLYQICIETMGLVYPKEPPRPFAGCGDKVFNKWHDWLDARDTLWGQILVAIEWR